MKSLQKGFSLIELMIALVLGLVIALAAIQLLSTNQRVFTLQQAVAEIYEDAYTVMRYINLDLRQSGRGTAITGIINPVIFESADPDDAISVTRAGANDDLVISYQGRQDCEGVGDNTEKLIINHYFVASGVLRCQGNQGATAGGVALLPGVERFNVLYGIDGDADGALGVTQFVGSGDLTEDSIVVAIRYGLLLLSESSNLPRDPAVKTFYILNESVEIQPNSRLYRSFTSTVQLRNFDWNGV